MFFSWIALPEAWKAQIEAPIGEVFADLAPLLFMVIGIFVAFYIIEEIIAMFVRKKE